MPNYIIHTTSTIDKAAGKETFNRATLQDVNGHTVKVNGEELSYSISVATSSLRDVAEAFNEFSPIKVTPIPFSAVYLGSPKGIYSYTFGVSTK